MEGRGMSVQRLVGGPLSNTTKAPLPRTRTNTLFKATSKGFVQLPREVRCAEHYYWLVLVPAHPNSVHLDQELRLYSAKCLDKRMARGVRRERPHAPPTRFVLLIRPALARKRINLINKNCARRVKPGHLEERLRNTRQPNMQPHGTDLRSSNILARASRIHPGI